MKGRKAKFRPHKKPAFYCDEDFPKPSLDKLNKFKVLHSLIDLNFKSRDDKFHYQYAANKKLILLTLDDDYLNNSNFKLSETYGLIFIQTGDLPTWGRVNLVLDKLLPFLKSLSKDSLRATKISVSLKGYIKWNLKENKILREEFNWRK